MPVEFGLWRLNGGSAEQVPVGQLDNEERLEEVIQGQIGILGLGDLLIIGRQVITDFGKRIDLLAIDDQGDLYVIELKRDRTPREVVAQALEYGWWVDRLSWDRVVALYAKHNDDEDLETAFSDHFDQDAPETLNQGHELVVVAARIDTSTEQIVEYVRGYKVPINVLFFQVLQDGDSEYLARSWLTDPNEESRPSTTSKKQPNWNGIDFFVAVGEGEHGHRNWDDMRRYGFVSAGHGDKYRRAMENLFPGARVWAYIPGRGYVGVGEVTEAAVGVKDFSVPVGGQPVPIAQAPDLRASQITDDQDDPENAEYLTRIVWQDTRPREDAFGRRACSPTRTSSQSSVSPSPWNDSRNSSMLKATREPPRRSSSRQRPPGKSFRLRRILDSRRSMAAVLGGYITGCARLLMAVSFTSDATTGTEVG